MNRLKILIKTSRPLGWVLAPLVFMLGYSLLQQELTILSIIQILLLSFPFCIFLYGINDIYDYNSDKINPRKKLLEGIKLDLKYHQFVKKVSKKAALILLLSSVITFNILNFAGMILLLFFSYFYSAPPLRFKEKPPLDSFANGILYFFAPFLLGFSFGGDTFPSINLYLISACVMGIHSFSTIMDYSVDKKIGDTTFAVVYGKKTASIFALLVFSAALLFGRFEKVVVDYYLFFCGFLFLIISIFPSEKIASLFFKLIFIGFIITATIFII